MNQKLPAGFEFERRPASPPSEGAPYRHAACSRDNLRIVCTWRRFGTFFPWLASAFGLLVSGVFFGLTVDLVLATPGSFGPGVAVLLAVLASFSWTSLAGLLNRSTIEIEGDHFRYRVGPLPIWGRRSFDLSASQIGSFQVDGKRLLVRTAEGRLPLLVVSGEVDPQWVADQLSECLALSEREPVGSAR